MASVVVDELKSAYAGKRVLVTGHTGFKGSWLTMVLRELGAEIAGYALEPETDRDLFVTAGLRNAVRHTAADIRDLQSLQTAFDSFEPEFVFHLAAQPLVRRSFANPKLTFDTNVGGSVNLLEAVRSTPSVRSLVFVTSDKCYRNHEWTWGYREIDELGGHDPYSASKAAAEIVFSSYTDALFGGRPSLGAASVRAGNVVGGGDWSEDRIVPDCVRALEEGKPIEIRSPESTRPWQHVLEPIVAYLLVGARLRAEPQTFRGAWNIGPGTESIRTVEQLVREMISNWGAGEIRISRSSAAPKEATFLHLNCDKADRQLGWRPIWKFARTIAETVGWYQSVGRGSDAAEASIAQVHNYLEERQ